MFLSQEIVNGSLRPRRDSRRSLTTMRGLSIWCRWYYLRFACFCSISLKSWLIFILLAVSLQHLHLWRSWAASNSSVLINKIRKIYSKPTIYSKLVSAHNPSPLCMWNIVKVERKKYMSPGNLKLDPPKTLRARLSASRGIILINIYLTINKNDRYS